MRSLILVLLLCGTTANAWSSEALQAELQAFAPFVGKTWRGELNGSTPEKALVDVSRWERALNGTAIRILHSVNDGEYGGESIVFWDAARKQIRYYYFTTGGFYTEGSMTVENNQYISSEKVSGEGNGITEVKGTGTLLPDGSLRQDAAYLKDGNWVQGHSATYRPAPGAEPRFR
jgi:hypothetical protein